VVWWAVRWAGRTPYTEPSLDAGRTPSPDAAIDHRPRDQHSQVDALNRRAYAPRHADARAALALCRQAQAMALRLNYQRGLAYSLLRMSLYQSILGAPAASNTTGCSRRFS
jgi:hypothetical protein